MNAPAKITLPATIRLDESATDEAYRRSIGIHCLNCDETEMAARVELAAMRDAATIGIARAGDDAAALLHVVSRMATVSVFAAAPASTLIRIKSALTLTMMAARAIERVQRNG